MIDAGSLCRNFFTCHIGKGRLQTRRMAKIGDVSDVRRRMWREKGDC